MERRTFSRFEVSAPLGEHRLPQYAIWGSVLVTAVGMAILNLATIFSMEFLISSKWELMQGVVDEHGTWAGIGVLVAVSTGFASALVAVIYCFAPDAGGSGSPENRGWLNGSDVPGMFTWRNLIGRFVAVIFSNSTGFPVGREGPTVTMGSNLAFQVTKLFAAPHVKKNIQLTEEAGKVKTKLTDMDQLALAQRVASSVGGACGMAMIFNSPIGGFLYMFEDLTAYSWPVEATFRSFVALGVCTILSEALLNMLGKSCKQFVLYIWSPQVISWSWIDVGPALAISIMLGVFGVIHTKFCLFVQSKRQRFHKRLAKHQPIPKVVETLLYAALCALLAGVASIPAHCSEHHEIAATMVKFNCPEGKFNVVASLLVTTSEGAVKRLFQVNEWGSHHLTGELAALIVYTTLNIGLTGIPVPSGNFTGTMLIGAMFGRTCGSILDRLGYRFTNPGMYSMMGAAAMLSSFKRMSFAVVMFLVGSANNLSAIPIIMLCVTTSLFVSRGLSAEGYDEEQVIRKKIPFMEPEVPPEIQNCPAMDLCDDIPVEALLSEECSLLDLRAALGVPAECYPVIRNRESGQQQCIGILPRHRAEKIHDAISSGGKSIVLEASIAEPSSPDMTGRPVARNTSSSVQNFAAQRDNFMLEQDPEQGAGAGPGGVGSGSGSSPNSESNLKIHRFSDEVGCMLPMHSRVGRFYTLFARGCINNACVVDSTGAFCGLITRSGLIEMAHESKQKPISKKVSATEEASDTETDSECSSDNGSDSSLRNAEAANAGAA
mmetsp:Transcript_22492/g.49293  ORF Transcript_22492/g.49293 Transcript_22492/m.49293 type:complete len:774 (-) Transcript_22492:74-2395(-)